MNSFQRFLRWKYNKKIIAYLLWLYYKLFHSTKQFTFQGKSYHYFYHPYNYTWFGERAVEIPIFWPIVKQYSGKNVLEVGNVLSHYFPVNHDIVDRYEKGEDIINQDVVNLRPKKKYDLIVSISTLEHVGWDEKPREPKKVFLAMKNLKKMLAPNGKIVVTLPLGYNPEVDKALKTNRLGLTKKYYLKRVTRDTWKEVNWQAVKNVKYSHPFVGANGLVIGIFNRT